MFRLLRFLFMVTLSILRVLFTLIIRFLLLPILARIFRILADVIFSSIVAVVNGPRLYTEQRAAEWTENLILSGGDIEDIDRLYSLCRFGAWSIIILGWLLTAFFTVTVFRVVYGFFI